MVEENNNNNMYTMHPVLTRFLYKQDDDDDDDSPFTLLNLGGSIMHVSNALRIWKCNDDDNDIGGIGTAGFGLEDGIWKHRRTQVGADIDGEVADDQSGHSIVMAADGNRIAIGAYSNNGNDLNGYHPGHVRLKPEWILTVRQQLITGRVQTRLTKILNITATEKANLVSFKPPHQRVLSLHRLSIDQIKNLGDTEKKEPTTNRPKLRNEEEHFFMVSQI